MMYPTPTKEIHADKALVFADGYKTFFENIYEYPPQNIFCVGNPKLDRVFNLVSSPPSKKEIEDFQLYNNLPHSKKFITYLSSPFVESGYEGWSSEFRLNEYKKLEKVCSNNDYHLIIKLHPAMFGDKLLSQYSSESNHVTIIKETDTQLLVYQSDGVLGHSSSTLLIPIIYKTPIIIIKWESCSFVNDRFSEYDLTRVSKDSGDLNDYLNEIDTIKNELLINTKREKFIKEYIKFEDDQSLNRIINQLTEW